MYGTVMIGRLADGVGVDDMRKAQDLWEADRGPSVGFVDEWEMRADDGRIIACIRFESKAAYEKLGNDPDQDRWYREVLRPMLGADPEWIDGEWVKR